MTNALWKQSFSDLLDSSVMFRFRNSSATRRLWDDASPCQVFSLWKKLTPYWCCCPGHGHIYLPLGIPNTIATSAALNLRIFDSLITSARQHTSSLLMHHELSLRFSIASESLAVQAFPQNLFLFTNHRLYSLKPSIDRHMSDRTSRSWIWGEKIWATSWPGPPTSRRFSRC